MKKRILVFAIILFCSHVLVAQMHYEEDTIKNFNLEEVLVKSPKYKTNIFEIPKATSVITERLITKNKIELLQDISGMVPNLYMADYGTKMSPHIYIRGVGNRIGTSPVGLYVDNIPYFTKSSFNFDLYDIERIEVLRGPQGTLYGRNTMGGLINIFTNSPRFKRETSLSAGYGNYNEVRANILHKMPLTENLAVLGSLNYNYNEGYYDNEFNDTSIGSLDSYSGRLKFLYNNHSDFEANLTLQYEDSDQNGYPYSLYNDDNQTSSPINYNRLSGYERSLFSTGLGLKFNFDNFDLQSMTSFQYMDDAQDIDQDFTPSDLFFVEQTKKLNVYTQEITIQSNNKKNYEWLFGVFGFSQNQDKDVDVIYGEDGLIKFKLPFDSYEKAKTYKNENVGVGIFHQSTIHIDKLTFSAGIRYDYEKASLDYNFDKVINGNNKNDTKFDNSESFNEILPSFSLKYRINNSMVPYVTVAKGYNSGGFNSTYEDEKNRTYEEEHSWNYEAGIKAKWLQKRVYTNLVLFYIDWDHQQIYQTVPSGTGSMLTNAGKSISKGVEFEIKYLPTNRLETWASFGYNDAEFDEYVKNENEDYSGNKLPYVPEYIYNIGFDYYVNVHKNWLKQIRLVGSYSGIGKQYWKETNVAYQDYYGLLNGRLNLEVDNLILSVWGKNLLDENYNSFYFQALGNSYSQLGRPVTVGVSVKYSF